MQIIWGNNRNKSILDYIRCTDSSRNLYRLKHIKNFLEYCTAKFIEINSAECDSFRVYDLIIITRQTTKTLLMFFARAKKIVKSKFSLSIINDNNISFI